MLQGWRWGLTKRAFVSHSCFWGQLAAHLAARPLRGNSSLSLGCGSPGPAASSLPVQLLLRLRASPFGLHSCPC